MLRPSPAAGNRAVVVRRAMQQQEEIGLSLHLAPNCGFPSPAEGGGGPGVCGGSKALGSELTFLFSLVCRLSCLVALSL